MSLSGPAMDSAEAQPDSLDGWVAVKEDAFGRPEAPHKLRFLVAWNALEDKFAVTCHNRTLQEREPESDPGGGGGGGQQRSWAGLYSSQALLGVHRQLAALDGRLEACFPPLPPALSGPGLGLWALLFPRCPVLEEAEREGLCRRLEAYLGWALELCGRQALLDSLFAQDRDEEDQYFESLQEFRRKALKAQLAAAKEALRTVLHRHKDADTLVALMEVYEEEDEAYWELVTVATKFYQYLLQPFRDMRELATLYKLEILKSLQADRLGPKRIEALRAEAEEWTTQVEEAMCSIQDITVSYFKETVTALAAMKKQMELDRQRFGQAAWAAASPRLENLKYLLAKETLQHMRARELCLNHKRADIRKRMEAFEDQENDLARLEELEVEYYETQLELYEVQFEILKNEEMLLVTQLETLRRRMKEIQDEVIYYDTCENPDELQAAERTLEETHAASSEMAQLRQKTQQLETKRGVICSRRAYLRNKKDQCEESRRLRLQQAQEGARHFQQHHSIQIKRDKRKEEEKKKKAWIKQEREKTLERLKTFKEKCPAQFVLKTSRSQPPTSTQRQGLPRRTPATPQQPLLLSKTPAKQSQKALLPQAKGVKAPSRKPPADISVQIFLPPCDPKQQKNSEGGTVLLPPPPPPPPPPPLLLVTHPICSKSMQAKDKPLPLACEEPPRGSDSKADAHDTPKCTASNYTGSMDEVLASLKRGEILLRKVEPATSAPPSSSCLNDNILAAIRKGVKLRKVSQEPKKEGERLGDSELERSIKAAIQRIKKVSADSEEEECSEHTSGEWNS